MDLKQFALSIVLGVVVLYIYRVLRGRNNNQNSSINLDDLLLGTDGRTSKAACILFGSFLLSSWVIVNLTLNGKLTEIIFGAYIATWVAPTMAKIITGSKESTDDKEPTNDKP